VEAHARGRRGKAAAGSAHAPSCMLDVESQRAAHLQGLGALVHQVAHQHDGVAAVFILAPAPLCSTHPVALHGVLQPPTWLELEKRSFCPRTRLRCKPAAR